MVLGGRHGLLLADGTMLSTSGYMGKFTKGPCKKVNGSVALWQPRLGRDRTVLRYSNTIDQ